MNSSSGRNMETAKWWSRALVVKINQRHSTKMKTHQFLLALLIIYNVHQDLLSSSSPSRPYDGPTTTITSHHHNLASLNRKQHGDTRTHSRHSILLADAKGVAGLGKAGGDGQAGSDKAGQQVPPEVYKALTYAGSLFLLTLSVPLILYGLNKLLNKIEDCFGCSPSRERAKMLSKQAGAHQKAVSPKEDKQQRLVPESEQQQQLRQNQKLHLQLMHQQPKCYNFAPLEELDDVQGKKQQPLNSLYQPAAAKQANSHPVNNSSDIESNLSMSINHNKSELARIASPNGHNAPGAAIILPFNKQQPQQQQPFIISSPYL